MYDRIVELLFEIGIDTSQASPQATFRELAMDSLSLTELAVMLADEAGPLATGMTLDTTLAEAAAQLAPNPPTAPR
ncbi:acyl carrier protein [Kitasatospora kifunensis]|uniref:Acyl carrier protein n=1 Tax=Kitasatospora kifunensis TaxID=58351 RepID=A0A7W7R694_KITKI|nr:acyl carrier protein [Kitasatospora kifunensis]MBB4926163.1 acyl carrier protein [Kitasatospora kifunensis]